MKRRFAFVLMVVLLFGACMPRAFAAEPTGWNKLKNMPLARSESAVVHVNNKIYVIGGTDSNGNALSRNDIYDIQTGTWSQGARMPVSYSSAFGFADDNKIFIFCKGINLDSYVYDIASNQWSNGPTLPESVYIVGAFPIKNNYFVVTANGRLLIYDKQNGIWDTSKTIPVAKDVASACANESKIYTLGTDIWTYDTETGASFKTTSIPIKRENFGCAVYDDKLYLIGGTSEILYVSTALIYDIKKNLWSFGPNLNEIKANASVVVADNVLYVFGGHEQTSRKASVEALTLGAAPSSPEKLSVLLNVGEATQLSVSQNLADNAALTWSTTNEAVAAVDASGKVTATGEGAADIFAANEDGTFRESIPVRVFPGTADEYRLALHLNQGATSRLYLTDDPAAATWSSADSTVATVSQGGAVTANSRGLAIITATLDSKPYQIYVRVGG